MGTNFWLEAGGTKYFLRKYRPYGLERIQEIHAAKDHFSKKGIPVIAPIRTRENATFFEWEGSHYALFPFVKAKEMTRETLNDTQLRNLGTFLADLHLAGKEPFDAVRETEHPWSKEKFYKRLQRVLDHVAAKPEKDAFDEAVLQKLAVQSALVGENTHAYGTRYPYHLTHNDYHVNNIFFSPDDEVSHIFDWEKTQWGTRARELARALELLASDTEFDDESFRKAGLLLGAYNDRYPISAEELEDGVRKRILGSLHAVWIEEEHYFNGNNRADELLAREDMRIRYYRDHFDEYVATLARNLQ